MKLVNYMLEDFTFTIGNTMEYVTIIEDNIYIHLKIRSGEKTVQEDKFASVIYSRQSIKKKRNYVKFSFVCTLIDHN